MNGHQFNFIEPTSVKPAALTQHEMLIGAPLTAPTKSHQRTLTEQIRSTQHLPPLVTQASESKLGPHASYPIHTLDSPSRGFARLPEPQPSPQQTRVSSPTRARRLSVIKGDKYTQGKPGEKVGKLADWFKGESEPISIGVLPSPTKEKSDPLDTMAPTSEIRPTSFLQRSSTSQTTPKPTVASRFSFLASKVSLSKPTPSQYDLGDELMDMDISTALNSTGTADPYSPAAFKNLQQRAEGLLSRLQAAYKERTISLRDMAAEKETLVEETQGAETRARHLKTQLDDMSAKLAEQDEAMMNLVDDLAREKLARQEEEEARKRSLKAVAPTTPPTSAGHSRFSLENTGSESSFDSEDDSSVESLFSRRDGTSSPTMSMSSVSTSNSPEANHAPDGQIPLSIPRAARTRLTTNHFHKGTSAFCPNDIAEEPIQSTCTNCNGVQAPEAWSVVGSLKVENAELKGRVEDLESALDGCLDVVNRLSY